MLLTIDPPARRPLPLRAISVAAGEVGSIEVKQGQLLKISVAGDGAVASLYGFAARDPEVFLSVHHTRVFSNSYVLSLGMRLVTNRRRPIMVLGQDSVGMHDLLLPASSTAYLAARGYAGQMGTADAVSEEMSRLDIRAPKLPDPVNLFLHTRVHQDGTIEALSNRTRAGDHVIFRVLIDATFVVSACCSGIEGNDRPAALRVSAAEDLSDLEG